MLRSLTAFWVISFLLGGAATAVSYFVGRWADREALIGGQVEALPGELPYWGILLLALLVGAMVSLLLRGRKKIPDTASLSIGEDAAHPISLTGLIDSGNLLTEPLGGRSVIFLAKPLMKKLLPSVEHWGKDEFWQGADA